MDSSNGMDATTTTLLQTICYELVRAFAAIVFKTYLLAIYTVLVFQASRLLIRKGTRVSMITLAVILLMFAIALVLCSFDITNFVHEAQITLSHHPELHMTEKYKIATQKLFDLLAPLDLLYAYEALLGDGIIIWRVWVLWGNTKRRWVVALPFALFVGSFVASFLLAYCVIDLGTEIVDGSFQNPAFCKNVQTVTYVMPTVTTAVATVLIGLKTWEYRKLIKPVVNNVNVRGHTRTQKVEKVMILLVESGVIYFVFFLVIVIGNIPGIEEDPGVSFAFFVYSYSTSVVVGMYPTIITLVANSDSAVLDTAISTTLGSNANTLKLPSVIDRGTRRTEDLELTTVNLETTTDDTPDGKKTVSPL